LAVTYTYTGPVFTSKSDFTVCGTGTCTNYNTTTMHVTGSFSTAAPIGPGVTNLDITASITAYSFNDGVNTIANGDVNARIRSAVVTTDGTGAIIAWNVAVERWTSGTNGAHIVGDRLNFIRTLSTPNDQGFNNEICASPPAGDVCTGFSQDASTSFADVFSLGSWIITGVSVGVFPTPALSTWGMIALAALVVLFGLFMQRRDRIV
jgi:hypothetical protein